MLYFNTYLPVNNFIQQTGFDSVSLKKKALNISRPENFGILFMLPKLKLKEHVVLLNYCRYFGLRVKQVSSSFPRSSIPGFCSSLLFYASSSNFFYFKRCLSSILEIPQSNNFITGYIHFGINYCVLSFSKELIKQLNKTSILDIVKILNKKPFYINANISSTFTILTKKKDSNK